MSLLQADSIRMSFDMKQILTDIYLQCRTGDIIGLLGRNGCGKSTLLKIIFGTLPTEDRFVKVDDKLIQNVKDSRGLIAYLPQESFLPRHAPIGEIIRLFCDRESARSIEEHPVIQPLLRMKGPRLSGGELRLLEILLILYSPARFVLIDEPFNGVAPVHKQDIKDRIREQSRHKGFIITDHDYRNVLSVATRIILLQGGATRELEDKDELKLRRYLPPED